MNDSALILAGHGSHISPSAAGLVWRYADHLRVSGAAAEVTACFWKEPPALSQAIDTVTASDVIVVPVFTASGYFTSEVLPAEMGLNGSVTRKNGKTITLTRALGEHPAMTKVLRGLILETLDTHSLAPEDTAAAIIGHGTRRNPQSRATAQWQAQLLRERNWLRESAAVFLDDSPDIPSLYATTRSPNIIALPYFLAPGSHVSRDVPRALGLTGAEIPQTVAGRQVYYCDPLGQDASISAAILELAGDAGLPRTPRPSIDAWAGFPRAGRETLVNALKDGETLRFGQVMATEERVWHSDNRGHSAAFTCAGDLRAHLRESPFRPLPTSADLPTGWHVNLAEPEQAMAVLETVYPGLVADWAAMRAGRFRALPLAETSKRQLGMFKDVHKLEDDAVERTIATVCGNCIRQPIWSRKRQNADLPCREACNLWLSQAIARKNTAP